MKTLDNFHIWSIVGDRYISTVHQNSGCMEAPHLCHFETLIFERDPKTKKLGDVLHQRTVIFIEDARKIHWQITASLLEKARME
jgi:hypothetical protein